MHTQLIHNLRRIWSWCVATQYLPCLHIWARAKLALLCLCQWPETDPPLLIFWLVTSVLPTKIFWLNRVDSEGETRETGQMRQTKYLFDSPVKRDWLFWVFCFFLLANAVNALQRVSNSGGIDLSPVSAFSGAIDAAVQVLIAWVMILPIYLIRKLIRKRKNWKWVRRKVGMAGTARKQSQQN